MHSQIIRKHPYSLSSLLQITHILRVLVNNNTDVEIGCVSLERIKAFIEADREAAWEIEDKKPGKEWPEKGDICFNDYAMRYKEDADLVIKGISCDIKGGEKVA